MKIIDETSRTWVVECEAEGCNIGIAVPKRIKNAEGKTILVDGPTPRRCILCGPFPK